MSLELALHSIRIFSGVVSVHLLLRLILIESDFQESSRPPMLLSLALPYLPKPFASVITYGFGYLQLAGAILDDLAAAVVGIGLLIAASHSYQNWSLA